MAVVPNLWVTIDLFLKECLSVITWNKKISIKASCINQNTPRKDFFAAATFKGL